MRNALVVIGVLGGGTAATFAIAGAIFLANPNGTLVSGGTFAEPMPAKMVIRGGVGIPPQPLPGVVIDDATKAKIAAQGGNAPIKVTLGPSTAPDVDDMTNGDLRDAAELPSESAAP